MFNFHTKADKLTVPQAERWEAVKALCAKAALLTGDGRVVFHGTTAMRAALIRRDGFRTTYAGTEHGTSGVHWGNLRWATWGAEGNYDADDPPAIIMARLADVLASGKPSADFNALESDHGERAGYDWSRSLDEAGALVMVDGRHVRNLIVVGLEGLPLHPRAARVRGRRLERWRDESGREAEGRNLFHEIPPGHVIDATTRFAPDSDVDLDACGVYGPRARYPTVENGPDEAGPSSQSDDLEHERGHHMP